MLLKISAGALAIAILSILSAAIPATKLAAAPLSAARATLAAEGIDTAPTAGASTADTAFSGPAAAAFVPATLSAPFAPSAARSALRRIDGLSPQALRMALDAVSCAQAGGTSGRGDLLTIIDYSLPSTAPRLWVLDLARGRVLFHELVAHGAGSGDNYATRFSNTLNSRQTSLGLFLTGGTYEGGNGYSLRLRGLDAGINDLAEERNIVMHGAWYVSADHAQRYGRLGRSWGCPAVPLESAHGVIEAIKDGTFVFSYSPAPALLRASSSSRCSAPPATTLMATAHRATAPTARSGSIATP